MGRFLTIFLVVFIWACTPIKETVSYPSYLSWNNIPEPFKGRIVISSFEVPFKYYPNRDRMIFPLTLAGFVSYSDKTLRLGKYKISLPVELWRILKHRLLKKDCHQTFAGKGYLYTCKGNGFELSLSVDKNWEPLKGEICDSSGCYNFSYRGNEVILKYFGEEIDFLLN
jgi:hypothetical protein